MNTTTTPSEGTTVVDCGDEGEVVEVFEDEHGDSVYDIRFESGDPLELTQSELELGLADGTIQVVP